MMNWFRFGDKSSNEFNVFISGEGTFVSPEKDIDIIEIPGRNGTLSISNGRYQNVSITYPAFIVHEFAANYNALKTHLLSQSGYQRLSDTYDADHYRLARYNAQLSPEMTQLNRQGTFEISFDCDPRRFARSGERERVYTAAGTIKNPTQFDALPLIRAYGTGKFTIGDIEVEITTADTYTDIDCELQEAFKGSINCNNNIVLTQGEFPVIKPGVNTITMTTITELDIIPRWWTI